MLIAHLVLLADLPLLWQAIAALLLAGWLPGILLVEWLLGQSPMARGERILYAIGASYTIMVVVMLFVSYLPGPVERWQTFVAFDLILILLAFLSYRAHRRGRARPCPCPCPRGDEGQGQALPLQVWAGLLVLLLVGGFFRLTNLDYSEFQGDEARAALRAAAVIQGYEDVLFIHKKGPTEILLPTVIYSLTGHLNEQVARLPFALANLTGLFAIFLLGWRFFGPVAGWSAAILLALDGYLIGFARIVQYQSIVFLMSVLVVLLVHRFVQRHMDVGALTAPHFPPRHKGQGQALPLLAGLFLATGFLSHYEAILALLPATILLAGWFITQIRTQHSYHSVFLSLRALLPALIITALILASFYIPFVLHPNFSNTYDYIADQRIGGQFPYNNLYDFFLSTTLYSTTYYLALMIGLVVMALIVAYHRAFRYGWLLGIPIVLNLIFTIWSPTWLTINQTDYTVVFFALVLCPIILLPRQKVEARAIWLWFALVSVGALFFTNRPYTHVYVFFIPWALISGMMIEEGWQQLEARVGKGRSLPIGIPIALCFIALFGTYAYWYFIYNKVEILANWHTERPRGFWTLYDKPPDTGLFGFPFKNGWKVIGVQYQEGQIEGSFDTNEKRDWTYQWYTRGQEFCPRDHRYYFLIDRLVPNYKEAREGFAEQLEPDHHLLANVLVNGQVRLQSYQKGDTALDVQTFEINDYEERFDRQYSGPYFKLRYPIISAPIQHPLRYRLGEHIWLEGYSLENDHARPGESVQLTLYWRPTARLDTSYMVFNQIIGADAIKYGQLDGQPGCEHYPTHFWAPNEIVEDQYRIPIFPEAKAGTYPLLIGMYKINPFENLPIYDANGQMIGNSIELTQITIEETHE